MVVKYRFRLYLLCLVMMAGFLVLVYRLWSLQIDRHDEFVHRVPTSGEERARIPGVRGEIRDRNGVVLASNRAAFEVRINLGEMVSEYKRQLPKGGTVPSIEYDATEGGRTVRKKETDVVQIFNETIQKAFNEMGMAKSIDSVDMQVHYRTFAGVVPWVYRDDLTFSEFSRCAEHNLGLPGVSVTERAVRFYPYGSLACHILGYVRLADDQKTTTAERAGWDYFLPDDYGGAGVEKSFNEYLRGKPGVRTMKKNERGRLVGEVSFAEPHKGNDVFLTLDARIQYIAERALREGGVGRGAAVVIDPASGEILAMASVPSYDPNRFIPSITTEEYASYLDNPANPLFNRAVNAYAPGSTFKIVTSFAGCLADIQNRHFNCAGGVTYGNNYMKCWIAEHGGSHGSLDVSDAIMRSCNCFFYQYGNAAGIDNITRVGQLLGVGERTGVELGEESSGVLPNPAWLRLHNPRDRWSAGHTANTSIGQGMVLATPLQMASVVATVANAGKAFKPHLLKRVTDGPDVVLENQPEVRSDLAKEGIDPKEVEMIRRGMWKVVNADAGTGKGARIPGVEVAGKTGTAQFWRTVDGVKQKDNHTWFITFAPYNNPKYAVCTLVQGGKSGGGCAAPVARRILEQSLALDNGYQVTVQKMPESKGSFKFVESVTYADSGGVPEAAASDEEGESAPVREASEERPAPRRSSEAPTIRRRADAAGSQGVSAQQEVPKAVPVRRAGLFRRLFQ